MAAKYIYWPEIENPYQKNFSFGQNSVKDFLPLLKPRLKDKKTAPDKEIVEFYVLNQYLAEAREKEGNVLNDSLIDIYSQYKEKINDLSSKMFSYIFSISLMEVRHCEDFSANGAIEDFEDTLKQEVKDFMKISSQNDNAHFTELFPYKPEPKKKKMK